MAQNPWFQALQKPAEEFPLTPLTILSGNLPFGLQGTLYRNGPACLERGGQKVGHWFDGDGAILAVHFTPEGAKAVYRYVQTAGYQAECAANQYLHPNYGMTVPGPFWKNWGREVKNSANTSVLALENKILALWEGGLPHALDPTDLATFGPDTLEGLSSGSPFSAHPKVDPQTGEIYNFGVFPGKDTTLQVYQSTLQGKVVQTGAFKLDGLPVIHDFVLAGRYLVFLVSPVRVALLPVLLGFKSFSDAMQWKPELGTEIIVLDRATLTVVTRRHTDAWYQWHFANGYEEPDGTVVAEFVRYRDFQTNEYLKSIPTGKPKVIGTPDSKSGAGLSGRSFSEDGNEFHTQPLACDDRPAAVNAEGNLWQLRLNPQTGKVLSNLPLLERDCEFPVVAPQAVGQSQKDTYLAVHREGVDSQHELYGAIACYHHPTATLTIADAGENRYPSEPIYVADPEASHSGWLLTIVYDANLHQSEVWIYQRDQLSADPLCRLQLPKVIPHSFHGTWQPKKHKKL